MFDISQIKIRELSKITGCSPSSISRYFKNYKDTEITKINNRIIGLSPNAAEEYLKKNGLGNLYKPSIILSANLCGGVGKTSSIYNLGACARRLTNLQTPIVFIDGDPQGSFTSILFGNPAEDTEPLLIDFLEHKASIDDILTDIGHNTWFVKSNLNQAFIDKVLSKPQDIKKSMLNFYRAIFDKFGHSVKIFQDHTPQLSNLFASSVCALHQLNEEILRAVIIPIRSDKFAIHGGEYILQEIADLKETFSLPHNIDIHCFFSSIDRRVSTTSAALKIARDKEDIVKHLSSVVIRYCSEIPKCIISCRNVYKAGKNNNAAQDYQDLFQYIFGYES